TFAAAGGTGLLRALHALRTAAVPPNSGLLTLSPDLALDRIPARIRTAAAPWSTPDGEPRRAAVSACGSGGTAYHLLLEAHPAGRRPAFPRTSAPLPPSGRLRTESREGQP